VNGADGPAWSTLTGGEFLERVLAAPLDPAVPATITAWLSTLTHAESSALTGLLHHSGAVADGVTTARQAVASLRITAVTAEIDLLQNRLRTTNPNLDTVLSLTTRLMTLKKELNGLQAKLREAPSDG